MEPLKEPRLRTGKKRRVVRLMNADGKFRTNGQKLGGPASANLIAIVEAIKAGEAIEEELYRQHKGRSDTLLMTLGIMHIHLYAGSKEVLFLRQYEDCVELIEINDHTPFDPPGAVDYFEMNFRNILWNAQRERASQAKKSRSALADAVAKLKRTPKETPKKPGDEE